MFPDPWAILHLGHGQVAFTEYLIRVLLHVLAFAAIALVARWGIGLVEAKAADPSSEQDVRGNER